MAACPVSLAGLRHANLGGYTQASILHLPEDVLVNIFKRMSFEERYRTDFLRYVVYPAPVLIPKLTCLCFGGWVRKALESHI